VLLKAVKVAKELHIFDQCEILFDGKIFAILDDIAEL